MTEATQVTSDVADTPAPATRPAGGSPFDKTSAAPSGALRGRGLLGAGWLAVPWAWARANGAALAEVALIAAWAAWVGRAYLNLDPHLWPSGREMGAQIITHHFWTQLLSCGTCALWNGSLNGGVPALGDVFGSTLHPLVMVATLAWGTLNGAKIALVVALWLAGVAQWWIARTLRLSRAARLWSALMVVVAGHLSGRMENANFGLIVSTMACSLALAAALHLAVTGTRRATILLALTGAMALVSGQGYLQLSLLAWAPAFLFLLLDQRLSLRPLWKEFALAMGLSLLMAGIFLVPMLHFWPNLYKEISPEFAAAQPLEYIPLNLIIRDVDFMRAQVLGKLPFPYMYNLYVGWAALVLVVLAVRFARRDDYAILLCLGGGAVLVFFLASAIPLRWAVQVMPELSGFRHIALVAGLAVPAMLALAAYGLDRLLELNWPQIVLRFGANNSEVLPALNLSWILAVPLGWSLFSGYTLSQIFLTTVSHESFYGAITALRTPTRQWVATPFGEHFWIEPALNADLKLVNVVWAWGWKDHTSPPPRLIANRPGPPPNTSQVGLLADIPIYEDPAAHYAYVVDPTGAVAACQAAGRGGDLTVVCENSAPGQLFVQENYWTGWRAWLNGARVPLLDDRWLKVDAPAGRNTYTFRYQPWDVPAGLVITLAGLAACAYLWWRDRGRPAVASSSAVSVRPEPG